MEVNDQEKIQGRLCATGRAKFVTEAGYMFTRDGFVWSLDPLDQEQYGITLDALLDCLIQLEEMGSIDDLKKKDHVRDAQGTLNSGIVLTSKKDPRIVCSVTLVDQDYENADVNLRWFIDLNKISKAAIGAPERPVDAEELKAVERAQEMNKEVKTESIDALFEDPIKVTSIPRKVVAEDVDGWGLPIMEEFSHVGLDAIEKPKTEVGKDFDEKELSDKVVLPDDPEKKPDAMKGVGAKGDQSQEKDTPQSVVKPGEPDDKPKQMGEAELKHVGVDALEKPHGEEGDKDRKEVAATNADIKPDSPEKKPEPMQGKGGQIGGTDKESDVAASKVKPDSPEKTPKLMAERVQKIKEAHQKAMQKRMKLESARKEARKLSEEKKNPKSEKIEEAVKHPLKSMQVLKKHMDDAHRAIHRAHHLSEWAQGKMKEMHQDVPTGIHEKISHHHDKMEEVKSKLLDAKKCMYEMCEEASRIHLSMKK